MTNEQMFDYAAARANESLIGRFGYRLWHIGGIPVALRRWGMRQWNARYTAALAYIQSHEALRRLA